MVVSIALTSVENVLDFPPLVDVTNRLETNLFQLTNFGVDQNEWRLLAFCLFNAMIYICKYECLEKQYEWFAKNLIGKFLL